MPTVPTGDDEEAGAIPADWSQVEWFGTGPGEASPTRVRQFGSADFAFILASLQQS
ncbi:hypothetical protein [Streptomyces erythrochromogenes]|uniref:hypothetical protein n=1 Tax=Streptomyces erythrochromogenes TaxID=285574 RepID=UPI000B28249A